MSRAGVSLLSTFGSVPRGVNMYTEGLLSGLEEQNLEISKFDYQQLYPLSLVPAEGMGETLSGKEAIVHWAKPSSWGKVAQLSSPLLHMQYWSPFTAYMLYFICRRMHSRGKRVVLTVHNPSPHEKLPGTHYFERKLVQSADALIVHSDQARETLLASYKALKPEKVFSVPHGIKVETLQPGTMPDYELTGLSPHRRYVLMFGNLRGYKGVPTLLKAWKEVIVSNQEFDLILAGRLWKGGGTPLSRVVARLLKTDKVSHEIAGMLNDPALSGRVVLQEGFVADEIIDAYCRLATIGVFPYTRFSGQSGAATRAAGWGLPLVVSNTGALPMLVTNSSQLVDPGDSRQLAEVLLTLMAEPQKLSDIQASQYRNVQEFSWEAVGKQHAEIYKALLA